MSHLFFKATAFVRAHILIKRSATWLPIVQLRENVEQYTGPSTADVTFGPRARPAKRPAPDPDDEDDGEGPGGGGTGAAWLSLLRARWRRDDKESLVRPMFFS